MNEEIYEREGKSPSQQGVSELAIIASQASQTASVDTLTGNLMFASSSEVMLSKHVRSLKQLVEAPAKGLPTAPWEPSSAS